MCRIIAYAGERHVDVVPCLEFFGRLRDLFRSERYADLAALPHAGDVHASSPQMQRILDDCVEQMTALFTKPMVPHRSGRAVRTGGGRQGERH